MTSAIVRELKGEWRKLRSAQSETPGKPLEPDALKSILEKCIAAGQGIADSDERDDVQWMARDIADAIRQVTGTYPDAEIKSLGVNRADTAEEPRVWINNLPVTGQVLGRDEDLRELDLAWSDPETNLITVVAWSGAGKSSLVNQWLDRMEAAEWRGARVVFGWTFSGQGMAGAFTTSDEFFDAAFAFFGQSVQREGERRRGRRLADLMKCKRTLLVLDGLETLQYSLGFEGGRLRDAAIEEFLLELVADNPGLCIITSRQFVVELAHYSKPIVRRVELTRLSNQAGTALLESLGAKGNEANLHDVVGQLNGHALALTLLGTFVREECGGDIKGLDELILLESEGTDESRATTIIQAHERRLEGRPELGVMYLIGLFNRVASRDEIAALLGRPNISWLTDRLPSFGDGEWERVLERLRSSRLLAPADPRVEGGLDAHPMVRAYFAGRLKETAPQAWLEAHRRLCQHLDRKAPQLPQSRGEMQSLFDAVYHGCIAGWHVEVFNKIIRPRILQWDPESGSRHFYSTNTLGLWGDTLEAIRHLFETPWRRFRDGFEDQDRAFILTVAGVTLRASYRLSEAIEATKEGYELLCKAIAMVETRPTEASRPEEREAQVARLATEAAKAQRHLNQTCIALGRLLEARKCGQRSVELADESGSTYERVNGRARYGEALHHSAELGLAPRQFEEAEEIARTHEPASRIPLLAGFSEFEYCDLLLTMRKFSTARERATELLHVESKLERREPLWRGLCYLVLGRLDLIAARTTEKNGEAPVQLYESAERHFDEALKCLDEAEEEQHVPLAYLAIAELKCETGRAAEAKCDLASVKQYASASHMLLHMTDYHLASVRCEIELGDRNQATEHLQHAEFLINQTSYLRRIEELKQLQAECDSMVDRRCTR